MSEILTPETLIAASALVFSFFTFYRGQETRKREEETRRRQEEISESLHQIEQARFQREEAAQADANFEITSTRKPLPHAVTPSQQPHDPPQPQPPQHQYTFYIRNVGKSTATDLYVEMSTPNSKDPILPRSLVTDLLPPGHPVTVSVTSGYFPHLDVALRWKDRAHPEGNLAFHTFVMLPEGVKPPPPPPPEMMPPSGPAGGAQPH
jgi:hypothetical protein